jgi:hypothetical protein
MSLDTSAPPRAQTLWSVPDRCAKWIAAWLLGCLLLAYGFDIGRGFISDDYGWIAHHRDLRTLGDLRRLFVDTPMGFFRPLVALSFFVNHEMFGAEPFGYAATNLVLVLGVAAALASLIRALGFGRVAAVFGAGLWMFNMHGIGMALTWISGRTSLLGTLFAVLAGLATVRRKAVVAGLFTLAALLSKEEPLLLPGVLVAWAVIDRRSEGRSEGGSEGRSERGGVGTTLADGWRASWPSFVALAIYLALRAQSAAMTPADAPSYYALSVSPRVLWPNIWSYADRAGTVTAGVLLIGVLAFARQRPRLLPEERRVALKGLVWLILGFGLTVMVPVRSDLYACLPSIGAALAGVAIGGAIWRTIPGSRRGVAAAAALLLPLALVPVYRARNAPNRNNALLAERIVTHVGLELAERDDIRRVELYQTAGERPSAQAAMGGALPVAIHWRTGRHVTSDVHLIGRDAHTPAPPRGVLHVRIDRGTVVSTAGPQGPPEPAERAGPLGPSPSP